MIKCPYCGSTAQVKLLRTDYQENGWTITRVDAYQCGCGCQFEASAVFESDGYETIENVKCPQDTDH